MKTLRLDDNTWDLVVDANGNIAMHTDNAHQCAQDVATSVRVFRGECYFDTARGVPFFENILGGHPPDAVVNSYIEVEAKRIDGVVASATEVSSIQSRVMTGTIYLTLRDNQIVTVNL